ncbi:MAG TPA: flagellar biosynthetic protein FliQ [Polyangiales bacterium]|jgi:flagellar biosynthetic protein FliQ|nr:flagellar biosynthetic protein FliQ [Polyangiales bacterium]
MTADALARLAADTLWLALRLAAPAALACVLAALLVGLFQAATQAHDGSTSFVAKLALAGCALFATRELLAHELLRFSASVLHQVAQVAR